MPTEPSESIKKEVLYPDDLPGYGPLVIDEYLYWETEEQEDREELPEEARYGSWLPIQSNGETSPEWIAAPRCLREFLEGVDAESGTTFEVLELEKSGHEEHAEYQGEFRVIEDGDPL